MGTADHQTTNLDFNLQHFEAELARLDILIQRAIHHWRLAGQDPADNFRGLYIADAEIDQLFNRPLGHNWGHTVTSTEGEGQAYTKALRQAEQNIRQLLESIQQQNQTTGLMHLASTFHLTRFDLDTLLICLAPNLDLRYERVYGYLQDDVTRKRPTVNLILDLLGISGSTRLQKLTHFSDSAPLFKNRLLSRGETEQISVLGQSLHLNKTLIHWLLGEYEPAAEMIPYLQIHNSASSPAVSHQGLRKLLLQSYQDQLTKIAQTVPAPMIIFYGADQQRQLMAADTLSKACGKPLLIGSLDTIPKDQDVAETIRLILRDALLLQAIPCLTGWDHCFDKQGNISQALVAKVCNFPEMIIITGQTNWQIEGANRQRNLFSLGFSTPSYPERLALWQHLLNEVNVELDLEALAGQFVLTTGQIKDIVASAKDLAAQRATTEPERDQLENQDLFLAARTHSNPRLATLARKIVPRYDWDDIVLPQDQRTILSEIVSTVRGRPQVLEQWGIGKKLASSAAVTVLFAGDPGTGKTMAAEVIAKELRLDLYKIDLSTMVSKYIGETEKNLERVFSEAESSNAILFFDEADAIFGKRSEVKDAHDRYANIEVSYLLQRMEAYDGVTILATNLRSNLDEAFTRRLQFAVDFPFPEPEDRLHIWQTLFPPDVPRLPDLNFELLAKRFKLAGGNIRNIIINAAYQAAADGGTVTMEHLLHGTRRELQKMGRLIGEDDLKI